MESNGKFRTVLQLSDYLNGEIIGDPSLEIYSLASIESDRANSITFYGHPRYERYLYGNHPRAILIPKDYDPQDSEIITFIRVNNVYEALSTVSKVFVSSSRINKEISPNSFIDPTAKVGTNVAVGHFSIIGEYSDVASNVVIQDQVFIGAHVVIGAATIIHTGAKILSGVQIGSRCIIYANAVIGGQGFGHAPTIGGYQKIEHQGTVIIEDDVEIGSNTCIDRGALSDTVIRKGAKLDNLIQIAHGVEIGEHVAIAAQSGVSGSSKIGSGSMIGGQVGIAGHVIIAPNSKIQAKSGVAGNIEKPGKKWYGYPILSYYKYLRSYAIFKRLPEILERIKRLENK